MRLAVGTAQFGMAYGVSNQTGIVNSSEAKLLLDKAFEFGARTIDTASAYGSSEDEIG